MTELPPAAQIMSTRKSRFKNFNTKGMKITQRIQFNLIPLVLS